MKMKFVAITAAALMAGPMVANALPFTCVSGASSDCAQATSTLDWTWDGLNFTIANNGPGYVSEVYFDLTPGMSVSFYSGTGGLVSFYAGASPGSLPGGSSVGFMSDAAFDSDAPGPLHYGIDGGESAIFRILNALPDSFSTDALAAGVHVRSLITGSASLVTVGTTTEVPEPGTLALFGLGLAGLGLVRRRRA